MQSTLIHLLAKLGIEPKPRFSPQETADILGIRWDQLLGLLKRGKIAGIRASERRWSGVLADDLSAYLDAVNAPSIKPTNALPIAEAPRPTIVVHAATTVPPAVSAAAIEMALVPSIPPTPPMTDLTDKAPDHSTVDDSNFVSKYNLNF